jgi:hypothetical protein
MNMPHTLAALRAGRLAGARRLDLSCGLTEFPREIFALADSLEILNLSGNALEALPDDLGRLHRLRVLFCSDNRFSELPASLGQCRSLEMVGFKANRIRSVPAAALELPLLRWLILTDNQIDSLPDALGRCARLQKLMLAGNRLQALPASLAACEQLELLRIAANRFEQLPAWLASLPRLAWLAAAGNPFDAAAEDAAIAAPSVPSVPWHGLALGKKIGQGASGVIHEAVLHGSRPVAVKLFKGTVTSDGWPHSEMAASVAAGEHPALVAAQGRIDGHPEGCDGLVMALVDPAFATLAGPPSFDSCTRDVYADDARWPSAVALRIARDIASAMRHLHARGIVHGDLYAHNILWQPEVGARLGDFGAAWMPGALGAAQARAFQAGEMRAFGCLLEELLARCTDAPAPAVAALAARCLQPDAAARPSFDEALPLIEHALSSP